MKIVILSILVLHENSIARESWFLENSRFVGDFVIKYWYSQDFLSMNNRLHKQYLECFQRENIKIACKRVLLVTKDGLFIV